MSVKNTVRGEFWRPEEQRLLVRRRLGWGWTVNFAEVSRRLRARRR